jgi:hypothetical protein
VGNGESFIAVLDLNLLDFNLISGQTIDGEVEKGLEGNAQRDSSN